VGEMHNLGYMPRQLTEDGFAQAKLAGAIKLDEQGYGVALAKSRSTWKYLPEDHALASQLLGVAPDELHAMIASPVDFAMYLSKRVTEEQLNLLVDSGIMSKIPMLTSEVSEFLIKTYKMPLGLTDLFIADPIEATQRLTKSLQSGLEQSAMLKLIKTEGLQRGWVITQQTMEGSPLYSKYVPLSSVEGVTLAADGMMIHPFVANQLSAVVKISKSPSEMNNVARAWKTYTQWFAKEAIGNPVGAKVYLFNQFMTNTFSTLWAGVGVHEYIASVIDITKLATMGLDSFDNVKPFRYADGQALTHREVVARTARMFSRDILPGLSGADAILKLEELDPRYFAKQLAELQAASHTLPEYAGEVLNVLGRKRDAILHPTIRLASILDMSGHLAVVRGKLKSDPNQLIESLGGSVDKWDDAITAVKQTFPVFDDVGNIPRFISGVLPFSSWAMQNLPLQMADMMRNPSRWVAYGRLRALWNENQLEDKDVPLNGEFTSSDLSSYGIILSRDPKNKETVMLMTDNFDPKWGVVGLLANTLSKGEKKETAIQDWTNSMISKSYFSGMYKVLSGIDPFTGKKRDDSEYNVSTSFAGINVPPWMAAVLSVSPVMSSLDRLPVLSGTREVLDPRTGAVLIPATQSWMGEKGKLAPNRLEGLEATLQTVGAKVRFIDGMTNMQFTESQIRKSIDELISRQRREQIAIQTDLRNGTLKESDPQYLRRVDAVNRMTDATIQINWDLARIEQWAVKNQVPSTKMLEEFKRRRLVLDDLPLPGSDYINQSLDQAYEQKIPQR